MTVSNGKGSVIACIIASAVCGTNTSPTGPSVPSVPLHNAAKPGMTMPVIGLGTGGYGKPDSNEGEVWNDTVAAPAVEQFLRLGGRRIDTSLLYYTQNGVGEGIQKSGVPREDMFITSKCDSPSYGMIPGGYNETMASIKQTLGQLKTDYIDLVLIHWPGQRSRPENAPPCMGPAGNNWTSCRAETWKALEDAFKQGLVKAIGTSNFEINHLQEIIGLGGLVPAVNQFEYHPYWHTDDLVAFCKQHDIQVNGYSPLGAPDHMAHNPSKMPVLLPNASIPKAIAASLGKTPAEVILRWEIHNGAVVNPRTQNAAHMQQNLEGPFGWELSDSDVAKLAAMGDVPHNVCGDPHQIP